MTVALRYVSSPVAVTLQSYYSAASTGFATWAGKGDGTQPPGTPYVQQISLQESPWNVVDVNATTWLASFISSRSADTLLSQIAINATVFPPPNSVPGTVVPPQLPMPLSISVTPVTPTVAKGNTQQFRAFGVYASGDVDLTNAVTWASSAASNATIAAGGLATTLAVGPTTISAMFDGVVGSTTLTVGAAALVSVAVTPAAPTIAHAATQQFTATGTYTDSSTQDLTSTATWVSSDPTKATIAAGGLATGVAAGTTNITAQSGAVVSPTDTLTLT
jgi:hypothetical protein